MGSGTLSRTLVQTNCLIYQTLMLKTTLFFFATALCGNHRLLSAVAMAEAGRFAAAVDPDGDGAGDVRLAADPCIRRPVVRCMPPMAASTSVLRAVAAFR